VGNRAESSAHFERPATLICSTRGATRPPVEQLRRADEMCADGGDDFRVTPVEDRSEPRLAGRVVAQGERLTASGRATSNFEL